MNDLEYAKELLEREHFTCALCRGKQIYTSIKTGIQPMIDFLEQGIPLDGYSAADKIVGKAAAMLFALAKIKAVYAQILSQSAIPIFEKYGINYTYETLTEGIINRSGSSFCPMELAVETISTPQEAFEAIKKTLFVLKNKETI